MLLRTLICLSFLGSLIAEDVPVVQSVEEMFQEMMGPKLVNPGAEVEIYAFKSITALQMWFQKPILGCYGENTETHKRVIYIAGPWTDTSHVLTHEFVHLLEDMIPEDAAKIRKVFQSMTTPDFRIGFQDLEPILPLYKTLYLHFQRGKLYK